uniref:Putative secreted protein n=1 Tax=Anopheles darlingi TaxID=43151 RepID=A0A2M4D5E9_ANODA
MYISVICTASSFVFVFGAPIHLVTMPPITSPTVLPALPAFSTKTRAVSRPFSCATALLSMTNFLIRPRYLFHSGDFSSSMVRNSLAASS